MIKYQETAIDLVVKDDPVCALWNVERSFISMMFEDVEDFFSNQKWILAVNKANMEVAGVVVLVNKNVDKFFQPKDDQVHAKAMYVPRIRVGTLASELRPELFGPEIRKC